MKSAVCDKCGCLTSEPVGLNKLTLCLLCFDKEMKKVGKTIRMIRDQCAPNDVTK